jgi:H+/Cl- antiporter ClcA
MNHLSIDIEKESKEDKPKYRSDRLSLSPDSETSFRGDSTAIWARDLFQLKERAPSEVATSKKGFRVGYPTVVLLFLIGLAAGLNNGLILMANAAILNVQARLITQGGIGFLYYLLLMICLVVIAVCCCKYGTKESAGSGLPQFKYILATEMTRDDYNKLLSWNVWFFKVIGLVLSVGGGLSVGTEGPLVLISACIAYLLMKYISYFDDILESPSLTKLILSASAAVGLGSAFNAPVGEC